MEYTLPEFVVGDVPDFGEAFAELPKKAVETFKELGKGVIDLLDIDSTATGFDPSVAHLVRS